MKKVFLAAGILLAGFSAGAQTISLGPSAGFGHSWLRVPDAQGEINREFHPTYNIGAKLVYSFVSHWGLSADVRFSGEGGKFETSDGDGSFTARNNYIRVPLQGIYFFEQLGDRVRPKVSFGPSFGFLVGGEVTNEGPGLPAPGTQKSKDLYRTFDFGLTAAVGANFRVASSTWLNTDISYLHGFSNLVEGTNTGGFKNSGLMLNVGLLFPINK